MGLWSAPPAKGGPVRWPALLAGNALVLLLFLSLALPAGEIYYRFLYDTTDSLEYTKVSRRWAERYWRTNSNGIRDDREYEAALTPGRVRVSFVGDSFTAGHGVKDSANRFVNLLREAHPSWDVHMIAMPGFDTGQELAALDALFGKGYRVNLVVLVYCLNDVSDLMPDRYDAWRRIMADERQSGWLVRNSYFVNILYHRLQVRREPFLAQYYAFVRDGYEGPLWERQEKRLRAFRDRIAGAGGRLAVVTFPFLHAMGPDYPYRGAHETLGRLWQELGVPHLDLLPVFQDKKPADITVNRYDAHPNEEAHALAARAMDPFLTPLVLDGAAQKAR